MLIKKLTGLEIPSSEITSKEVYLSRRKFMVGAAALASTAALAACSPGSLTGTEEAEPASEVQDAKASTAPSASADTDELGDPLTPFKDV
ncbi:MAG: twin-arginine translocation signal domain-containing protein, partial [Candidatus Promineifilaceae bacterium]|nr:twin-arginine translocation signal domain-containing protein [Candidatus Promineifilaceae bacterium]